MGFIDPCEKYLDDIIGEGPQMDYLIKVRGLGQGCFAGRITSLCASHTCSRILPSTCALHTADRTPRRRTHSPPHASSSAVVSDHGSDPPRGAAICAATACAAT